MNQAERILELERQLRAEREYSSRLRRELDRREDCIAELETGWYVLCEGEFEGPYNTRKRAVECGETWAKETGKPTFTVRVDERHAPPEFVDMDAYNGVQRGVDYPYTM